MSVKQKRRFLSITKHRKTGAWRTIQNLIESGTISDIEKEVFGQAKIPRIELLSATRVKTRDNKEYLVRCMRAIGVSEIGAVLTLPLADVDFTRKIPISADTAKTPEGTDVKILRIGTGEFTFENSEKIYLTPWSKENCLKAHELYPPSEDNDLHGKISYMFKKDSVHNGEISISSLEEFLTDDFDGTFERIRAPAPSIHIDSRHLHNYLKQDAASKDKSAYQ